MKVRIRSGNHEFSVSGLTYHEVVQLSAGFFNLAHEEAAKLREPATVHEINISVSQDPGSQVPFNGG